MINVQDLTLDLIKSQLFQHDKASGIIIEGYPRTLQQIAEYEQVVSSMLHRLCMHKLEMIYCYYTKGIIDVV